MILSLVTVAATTATKWLTVGKILIALGGGAITIDSAIEAMKARKRERR